MGVSLRYKILVHDFKIRDVLYNNGTSIEAVQFEEVRIDTEQFVSYG
jgi:hypothetical protein